MQRPLTNTRHPKPTPILAPIQAPAGPGGREGRPKGIDRVIGAKVRSVRIHRGLSQEKLGDKLGITFQQVQKYEKGVNSIAACRMPALCEALGIKPADLFDGITMALPAGQVTPPVISAVTWKVALAAERLSPNLRAAVMNVIRALNRDADDTLEE
jgi:transcriptional regulator with XRE-family HTH domain